MIEKKLRDYYKRYYKDRLGLRDWQARIENRLDEENYFALPMIRRIEEWFGYNFSGKRVLVVGAGTGAETIALKQKGADVFSVEPDSEAYEILLIKAGMYGIAESNILSAKAESLPFQDTYFDFVYCYTVLEHVQDVKKSISEMIRVCKPGGFIFIETPNYRMCYEPHYKIFMPTFLPKVLLKFYLLLLGRPICFLDTLNFNSLRKILVYIRHKPVVVLQALHDFPIGFARFSNPHYLMSRYLGVERDAFFMLYKLKERRK